MSRPMRIKAKTVASAETSPPPLFLVRLQEQSESGLPDFQERCPFVNGLSSLDLQPVMRSCFALAALMSPQLPKKKVPQKAAPLGGLDGDGRMHHFHHPEICPKTHRIYHEMLYPYVLQQIQNFVKSMRRRKVNSPLNQYADIEELTPEILDAVIERIEIGHVTNKSRPGNVIRIYWKLR